MESRIEDLEIRLTHIEAEQEQLTLNYLHQQKTLEQLLDQIELLKSMIKNLGPSAVAPQSEETPPPHY